MSDMDDIQAIFFAECSDGLAAAEAGLSAMAEGDQSGSTMATVFRVVHSIKGGSGAFGRAKAEVHVAEEDGPPAFCADGVAGTAGVR